MKAALKPVRESKLLLLQAVNIMPTRDSVPFKIDANREITHLWIFRTKMNSHKFLLQNLPISNFCGRVGLKVLIL